MKTDDSSAAFLSGRGEAEGRSVFDFEKLGYLLKRFADVEEFLGKKLLQLSRYHL